MTNQFMGDTLIQWIQTSTTVLTLGHMHCLCIITLAFLMGLQHSTTTSPLATIKHEGHHIFKETIYMYYTEKVLKLCRQLHA